MPAGVGKTYAERSAAVNAYQKQQSAMGRDIAPLPKVADPKRRESCRLDFRLFCETYYAEVFKLAWSQDHLNAIAKIQESTLEGGKFAFAFPRGSGKTSLMIVAAEWAILYGHRSFVVLVGATETHAQELLDNIKTDFETNDTLADDFPEALYPIRKLEGITKRADGQLFEGESTRITWTQNQLSMPVIQTSPSSGASIKVAGITGRIRGMAVQKPDGTKIRPDFVLIDDPQTDESAMSPRTIRKSLSTVSGTIAGLAGPGKKVASFAAVTVITKGDVADQLLDRKSHPEWQGVRIKLLPKLPTNVKVWEQYAQIRADGLRAEKGLAPATDFYKANRAAMDEGAEASWEDRFNPDEASAIQHAMNLKLTSEEAFAAEYQNEPLSMEIETELTLTGNGVFEKVVNIPRGVVPKYATKLVAFADVQAKALFWVVCAFGDNFTGHVVDYGTYPEQPRSHFSLSDMTSTLQTKHKGLSTEGQIRKGLDLLFETLLTRQWKSEDASADGKPMSIDRMLVDSGFQQGVVKQAIRESKFKARLIPSKGFGIPANNNPMETWKKETGDRKGWNWHYNRNEQHIVYDTNAWKTFYATRLLSHAGEQGNLSIFHESETRHRLFAEHLTAEYATPTEGRGRVVNIWGLKPNRDNHWLDGVIGCYVAASEQGILFDGHSSAGKVKRRKLNFKF